MEDIGGETVHPDKSKLMVPFRQEYEPKDPGTTPKERKVSTLSMITLLKIPMKRLYWCSPGNSFPLFFITSELEKIYLASPKTGHTSGLSGFE